MIAELVHATAGDDVETDAVLRAEIRSVLGGPGARAAWRALERSGSHQGPHQENDPRALYRLLGRHRLLAPNWPHAFGGRGLPARSMAIVVEEMIAAGVPEVLHTLSVQICGNFLLTAGTPEQRAALLPSMAAGTAYCTVLYTEPAVGSDLASLTTVAESDGAGGWLITGRKVYSVRTWLADLGLVAARSGQGKSQYQGITLFLVPLDAPGVTIEAVPCLADEAFADVTLSEVRVSGHSVVGQAGGAWPLITSALALERTGVDHVAKAEAWLRAWARADLGAAEHGAAAGRLWTRVQAGRALSRNCVAELDTGQVDPVGAAITKLWTSQTAQDVACWTAHALHDAGLAAAGDSSAVAGGRLEAAYREAPGLTISAGTSEMMCELIAAAGLPGSAGSSASPTHHDDSMVADLQRAVRWVVTSPQELPDATGPGADWPELASYGVFGLAVPESAGGFELGMTAQLAVVGELGEAGYDGGLLDTLAAIDALVAGLDPAGLDPTGVRARYLDRLLAGKCAAALAWAQRPSCPVADPGQDGLLLVATGEWPACEFSLLAAQAGLAGTGLAGRELTLCRSHRAMATVAVSVPALEAAIARCQDTAADAVLAADLARRAAWLLGSGRACLAATMRRATARQQFGRALIDNQSIAFRLARLSAHAAAIAALVSDLGANAVGESHEHLTDQPSWSLAAAAGAAAEAGRFATDAAREGMQLHGAFGMIQDSPVEPLYRQIRVMIAQCPPPWLLDRLAADPVLSGGAAPPR